MTVYFNGGTQPLVPEGRWGEGVVMPGERYETDAVLSPPWTIDAEAASALLSLAAASATIPPDPATEAVSVAQDAPQPPQGQLA